MRGDGIYGGVLVRLGVWIPNRVGDDEGGRMCGDDEFVRGRVAQPHYITNSLSFPSYPKAQYLVKTSSYPIPIGYPDERSECRWFFEVRISSKPEGYGSPIELGMTRVASWGDDVESLWVTASHLVILDPDRVSR
jgi:hypothetical protein